MTVFKGLAAGAALTVSFGATLAFAQSSSPPETVLDEVLVVGSRVPGRLATETAAPVDVFSGEMLAQRGFTDLGKVLGFLAPSFNYPRSQTSPSSSSTRGFSLRGLGPDQVLILVNGHRRHASSVLNFNNGVGRGTVPVDINTIPVAAIARIEVLRDGAAAQYGSDAIAGVINIVLRSDARGGEATLTTGVTEDGDGQSVVGAGRLGLRLGHDGFLTVTGEARNRKPTNSAEIDPRVGRVSQRTGDPEATNLLLTANAEVGLPGDARAYGFGTLAWRDSTSTPLFRLPSVAPTLYPNGFLPYVNLDMLDLGGAVGVRGEMAGWRYDLSDTAGYDRGDFKLSNSVNTSLGAGSPTRFDSGGVTYGQNIANLTVSRAFRGVMAGANLALGLEHRRETFKIRSGETASFTGAGAQGFPGFNPPEPIDVDRHASAAFVDAEFSPVNGLDIGVAGRAEDYSDFGRKATGKVSAFWRATPWLAARTTASTGFRAPSLQQQYFSTVTSQLSAGALVNIGTFAVTDPVARALGASDLRPETSKHYSGGVVLTPREGLTFSLDAFRIEIEDRIALSESLTGAAVTAILQKAGITNASQVRFFTNALDTRTQGIEATGNWRTQIGRDGKLSLTFGYAAFDTDPRELRSNPVIPALPLLAATSLNTLADAEPRNKLTLSADLRMGRWSLTADAARFGRYKAAPVGPIQVFGSDATLDLTVAYQVTERMRVQAGVLNATDAYPDRVRGQVDGRPYTEAGGIGVDGREYFIRLGASF
ncbi:TonB-dependent siderophore receptor [Caulobacter sp. FWC26]|jgi:iron complex outermembrane receptor protein|uniref:TonB-dependent receptor plug domain-containing protein n=1 Tax=Caulobacter sp. FWC26 TaxID=69665 RepID=UPI000C151C7C|nr:TonB-dependent receptor [Caulobacter sp. FWC26]AZS21558.1 TonB-dependent receptor [Caulobacter sp. FWC26]